MPYPQKMDTISLMWLVYKKWIQFNQCDLSIRNACNFIYLIHKFLLYLSEYDNKNNYSALGQVGKYNPNFQYPDWTHFENFSLDAGWKMLFLAHCC